MSRYIKYENKRVSNSTYYRKEKIRRIKHLNNSNNSSSVEVYSDSDDEYYWEDENNSEVNAVDECKLDEENSEYEPNNLFQQYIDESSYYDSDEEHISDEEHVNYEDYANDEDSEYMIDEK